MSDDRSLYQRLVGSTFKSIFMACLFIGITRIGFASAAEQDNYWHDRLREIHEKIHLIHGNLLHEYPEQLATVRFLHPDAKVLELGSNLGANTCVIATILDDSSQLVTVETRQEAIRYILENRDYNRLQFHVESSAVSSVPLIQKGWIAIPSEVDLPGYTRLSTITFDQVQQKYEIIFDTLVADCEGALYDILKEDPDVLKNIKLVIIENDFRCEDHYKYVRDLFIKNGFELVYNEGHLRFLVDNRFYQVWKKPL